jgi:hypothetical protein
MKRRRAACGVISAVALSATIALLPGVANANTANMVESAAALEEACPLPSTADDDVLAIVYDVASSLHVSAKVLLSGFEAGWVESHMNNLPCGDADSLGVFQQRTSQGWGTPEQIGNVRYAANAFFSRAIVTDSPSLTPGQLAQAVQRSAYPDRYDAAQQTAESLITRARTLGVPAPRVASGLDSVSWGAGRVDAFARSGDNHLLHRWFSSGAWSGWNQVGTVTIASDPSVASWGDRRLDVFARSTANTLVHVYFTGTSWFVDVMEGGTITSGPEVVSWGDGRIDVVARGGSNQLVHWSYDRTSGWAAHWDQHGGLLTSDPTIASWAPGRLDVFASDDKHRLVHIWYANGAWSGWEALSGEDTLTSAPDAVSWGPNRIDVVVRNSSKKLGHLWYNGTWNSQTLGSATLSGPPTISSQGVSRLDVFLPDADKRMVQGYLNGDTWSWVGLGNLPVA